MPDQVDNSAAGKAGPLSYAALFTASAIWGFAFTAQKAGMDDLGPFAFNAARFLIGGAVILPFAFYRRGRRTGGPKLDPSWLAGILVGFVLLGGVTFQQAGLVYTTASKAGFITGLYVVIVPIMGLAVAQYPGLLTWAGAILAVAGMWFLSVKGDFTVARGDLLVLCCAFFWAIHVQVISRISKKYDAVRLAAAQFLVAAVVSLAASLAFETTRWVNLVDAAVPVLYAGVLSTAVAYTLQIVGQRGVKPAYAAIVFCLEAVFAAFGGWLLLNESLSSRDMLGCGLMLAGVLLAQFDQPRKAAKTPARA